MARTPIIPRLDLPPNIDPREVAKAARDFTQMRERHEVERRNLIELEHERDAAAMRDKQALADAIRAGKPDPGTNATVKAEQAIKEKARELAATEVAAKDAHRELLDLIERHRPDWAAKVGERIETRRAAARDAIDGLERAYAALREDQALRRWLDGFPGERYRPHGGVVPGLLKRSGEPYSAAEVVAMLRDVIDPPPAPPTAEVEPLRSVPWAGAA